MRRWMSFWLACVLATLLSTTALASAAFGLLATNDEPCLIKVTPSDPESQSQFGTHVALSGDTMVVGRSNDGRAVYVFVRSAAGWSQQQKIEVPVFADPRAVTIDRDTLAISLPGEVQVWVRSAGVWQQQASLTQVGGAYVGSLDIDGDTLVAGPFVFVRNGGSWSLQQKLASGRQSYGTFAEDVCIKGDTIVAAAYREAAPVRGAGAIYVFERTGSSWRQSARLVRENPTADDALGGSVEFDGQQVVAGVSGWASQTGAICFWRRSGTGWIYTQQIASPDGLAGNLVDYGGDSFGAGLGLAGDTLVVGAPENDAKGSNAGALYILRRANGIWAFQRKITAPDAAAGDYLGHPLAVDNGRVAASVRLDDSPLNDAGSVYAFDLGFVTPTGANLAVRSPYVLVNDGLPQSAGVTAFATAQPAHGTLAMQSNGAFTYTPKSGWKGTDRFAYAYSDGSTTSNQASVAVQTWQPMRLSLSASKKGLKATLKTAKGKSVSGQKVVFERLAGKKWVSLGSVKTGAGGTASKNTSAVKRGDTVRARTSWSATYGTASTSLRVVPQAQLTGLRVPTSVRKGKAFTTSGLLKPRHKAGTSPVKLHFDRLVSGKWVQKKVVSAKVKNASGASKFSKSVSLGEKGQWRVRAYHPADSSHAASWSSAKKFKVK